MAMQEASTTVNHSAALAGQSEQASSFWTRKEGYLFNPVIDFLCLGGGATLILAVCALLLPASAMTYEISIAGLWLAHVLNHPHFAHSYQIFYKDFGRKLTSPSLDPVLRARYAFAGIAAPILLIGYFGVTIALGDKQALGFAVSIMGFFVGWHYVKQGYGMAMVDAVLKRRFYNDTEKKILLVNAYVLWAFSWLVLNYRVHANEMWGLQGYAFDIPQWLLSAGAVAAAAATGMMLYMIAKKARANGGKLAWNGVCAYLVTLYIWIFSWINPFFIFLVPAAHSLQYLVVVYRYQLNVEANREKDADETAAALKAPLWRRVAVFIGWGLALGYIGFWGLPKLLTAVVPYDQALFGSGLFLFMFWIFINVHHYFLDNVIWRKENPETAKNLFA